MRSIAFLLEYLFICILRRYILSSSQSIKSWKRLVDDRRSTSVVVVAEKYLLEYYCKHVYSDEELQFSPFSIYVVRFQQHQLLVASRYSVHNVQCTKLSFNGLHAIQRNSEFHCALQRMR